MAKRELLAWLRGDVAYGDSTIVAVKPAVLALLAGLAAGLVSVIASVQLILTICVLGVALFGGRRSLMLSAVASIVVTGLVRRLVAEGGHLNEDPLAALPAALLSAALIASLLARPRVGYRGAAILGFMVLAAAPIPLALLGGQVVLHALFYALSQALVWATIWGIGTGRLPNVWENVRRAAPVAGVFTAIYGAVQFVVLPSWDAEWMRASGLSSIGHAAPFQVRVFGPAESPGPFAALLGVAILCTVGRLVRRTGASSSIFLLLALALQLGVLFLTGVRAAIVSLVITLIVYALASRKLKSAIVVAALFGGLAAIASWGIGLFSLLGNGILTSQRFDVGRLDQDASVQSRLALLSEIPTWVAAPIGHGPTRSGGAGNVVMVDNAVLDVLRSFGPLYATIMVGVVGWLLVRSMRGLVSADPGAIDAALAGFFLLVFAFAANIFATSTGVLAAVALGAVVVGPPRDSGGESSGRLGVVLGSPRRTRSVHLGSAT